MYPILTRQPLEWTKMDILHTTKYTFCPGILEVGRQGGQGGGAYARSTLQIAPPPQIPPNFQTLRHPCCHVIPV